MTIHKELGEVATEEELSLFIGGPPKYRCGTHGDHTAWVAFWQTGEATRLYCTRCIEDFLSRQSIGKVVLPLG